MWAGITVGVGYEMRIGGVGGSLRRKNDIALRAPRRGFVFNTVFLRGLDSAVLGLKRNNEKEHEESADFGVVDIMLSAASPRYARIGDVTKGVREIGI